MALMINVYKKSGGHVLTHLLSGSGKTTKGNELETIYPPPYMQPHNGGKPYAYVATYRRELPFSHPSFFEIFQISTTRMKAETLSWSSGWQSFLHDSVHKTGQRYDFKLKQQNNCGKYYLILIKVKKPGMKNRELTQTINRVNSIDESS